MELFAETIPDRIMASSFHSASQDDCSAALAES